MPNVSDTLCIPSAGQSLLSRPMGEWSPQVLSGKLVLPLFRFSCFVVYGIPGEIGSDITGYVGIDDTVVKEATLLPSHTPRASQSAWSSCLLFLSCSSTRTGSIVTPPPCHIDKIGVVVSEVNMTSLDYASFCTVKSVLGCEGSSTAIRVWWQRIWLSTISNCLLVSEKELGTAAKPQQPISNLHHTLTQARWNQFKIAQAWL